MISLIFAWYLLTTPSNRLVCQMWISQPPTAANMTAAGCVWSPTRTNLILQGVDLYTGEVVCERPASELPTLTCDLWPLDHYLLRVIEPDHQDLLCNLSIRHEGLPTLQEIADQCPPDLPADYILELATTGTYTPPTQPDPVCPLPALSANDLPVSPSGLATAKQYDLLAYHLRWYYGSDAELIPWQNQFDTAIYNAGRSQHIPPKLLKAIFAQETQFWPTTNRTIDPVTDEVGIGQLTDDGADLVLRYSPALYNQYCPQATIPVRCGLGYDMLYDYERQMIRDILRRSLLDDAWWPHEAARQAEAQIPTWGAILQAYYCAAGELAYKAGESPSWDYALAAYHAGPECLSTGEICQAGKDYIEKVRRQ